MPRPSQPKGEKRVPRGLKAARDDKNKGLAAAHPFGKLRAWLKLRPFKTSQNRASAQDDRTGHPVPITDSVLPDAHAVGGREV